MPCDVLRPSLGCRPTWPWRTGAGAARRSAGHRRRLAHHRGTSRRRLRRWVRPRCSPRDGHRSSRLRRRGPPALGRRLDRHVARRAGDRRSGPEPHDLRFDFPRTARCRMDRRRRTDRPATLAATALPDVVGHLDWRVQNLAFAGDRVSAIYDWDSVGLVPEAALVGSASVIHPSTGGSRARSVAHPGAGRRFRRRLRVGPWRAVQRRRARGPRRWQRWVASFGARCQHSDDVLGLFPDVDHSRGWPRLLADLLGR